MSIATAGSLRVAETPIAGVARLAQCGPSVSPQMSRIRADSTTAANLVDARVR